MFKTRRKAKEQADAMEALTGGHSPPTTYKTAKSLRRKNKNDFVDSKPVFDLSSALPGDKEFRTSLLMPNLSARFSMLREQDDPNTKLGKASDDSVLFPKRASRMNLFNNTALADVAEVESIYSFRPPFADRDRSDSMTDGYDSDGGSVMSRSRPGEGNNLFGGRQKLYRIPTGSTKNLADPDGTIAGRHMYEGDVSLSLFQQFRKREKDRRQSDEENRLSIPATDTGDSDVTSPATAFSKNRGTQSSTNSIPRRSSTAATSIVSESPVLRHSGLENAKFSNRPDSVENTTASASLDVSRSHNNASHGTALPTRLLSQSKSTANLGERFQRPGGVYSTSSYRSANSPSPLPASQPLDFGFKSDSRSNSATGRHQMDSPTPNVEGEDMLASALQPNDRGKATAMGLFNKPAREFDEQQFNQRQRQMHEGNLSSMSNSRSASRASDEVQKSRQGSATGMRSPSPVKDDRTSTPQIPPVPSTSASPVPSSHRASKASGRSTPPRPRSKSSASATAHANVKARVESLIRKQNAELAALEAEKLGNVVAKSSETLSENKENDQSTFDNDDSEYEETELDSSRVSSSRVDEADIHPAFRNSHRISDGQSRRSNYSNFSRSRSIFNEDSVQLQLPVLGFDNSDQADGFGLSGLIRTHLRHDSDKSSFIVPFDQGPSPGTIETSRVSVASGARTATNSIKSEYFDMDGNNAQHSPSVSQAPPTPTTVMSQAAQQILSQAQALTAKDAPPTPTTAMSQTAQQFLSQAQALKDAADKNQASESAEGDKPWHEEMEPTHRRGESSETTKERREFDEDLAERRRKIREGLKSVTERDRSQSPGHAKPAQSVSMQAFVQQRAVTDPQKLKAVKTLGLQSPNTTLGFFDDDRSKNANTKGERKGRTMENGFQNTTQTATFARFGPDPEEGRPSPTRSNTPPGSRFGSRARSNSNANDRSKSRTRAREPSNPPLPPGYGNFSNLNGLHEPTLNQDRARGWSGSMTAGNGARSPPPDLKTNLLARESPRPSPITPASPYDASMERGRPSPGPFSNSRAGSSASGRGTPTGPFNRKRSVTKTMISEPTFVSSTSSVPLVQLPHNVTSLAAPPVPAMNPRRRGNTASDKPTINLANSTFARTMTLETVPASPLLCDFETPKGERDAESPSPRKLRKANSEGGSMAAKARTQARNAELAKENSPAIPMFPNRSATNLDMSGDGGMF